MAKRRADDTVLRDSPSKRCCRSLHSVDKQLQRGLLTHVSMAPPSLLALLGSRCRKRPHYFEDPAKDETTAGDAHYNLAPCDTAKRVADVSTVRTSGSFEEHRTSATFTSHKKRHREDGVCPDTEKAVEQLSVSKQPIMPVCTVLRT